MIVNSKFDKNRIKKCLYLVSTPIGNLGDITYRAVEVLKKSDLILCEDTRVSKNLLSKYDIKTKLLSNHKFNEKKNLSKIIYLLKKDSIISLISDAGTPGISDPGSILVNECIKNGIEVIPIPGPSAITSALSVSGFSDRFFFYGFFPEKEKTLKNDLNILSKLDCSIIFFVSAKKINKFIPHLKNNFSGRKILICREISKFYEEYKRIDINKFETFSKKLKGELTLVISDRKEKKNSQNLSESDKRLIEKMKKKLSIKEIISLIHQKSEVSKKEIYNYFLKIKDEK